MSIKLLFTADPAKANGLMSMGMGGLKMTVIGIVTDGDEVLITDNDGQHVLEDRGWEHFRGRADNQ